MEAIARTYRYLTPQKSRPEEGGRPRMPRRGRQEMIKRSWTLAVASCWPCWRVAAADEDELQPVDGAAAAGGQGDRHAAAPPKKFLPSPTRRATGVDPFSPQKLTVAIKQEARAAQLGRPRSTVAREELEQFPLDSMSMVGRMFRAEEVSPYALLRVDNLQTRSRFRGDYLGQNYGSHHQDL